MKMKKGQVWVSAVLYMLIASIIIILILEAGLPIIQKNKERSVFEKSKEQFIGLDSVISDVIEEGSGSQRVVPIEIPDGKLSLEDNALKWELETETQLLEPRSEIQVGNVKIVSDIDVDAYDLPDYYYLENSNIAVNFTKTGNITDFRPIDTSKIIESFYVKDTDTFLDGNFSFMLDNNPNTRTGIGYTELVPPGNSTNLDFARVVVHMHNDSTGDGYESYRMHFTLDSKADFIRIDIKDFEE